MHELVAFRTDNPEVFAVVASRSPLREDVIKRATEVDVIAAKLASIPGILKTPCLL